MVEQLTELLMRAAFDILKLECRVSELEYQLKIPEEKRFSVRDKWLERSKLGARAAAILRVTDVVREARRLSERAA